MDNHTERLTDGVWRIETGFYVNTYLVANNGADDGDGLTLVDCGVARHGAKLVRSIRLLGFDPTALCRVLLTHWHAGHAGAAARFAASSAEPEVWIGRGDVGVMRGNDSVAANSAVQRVRTLGLRSAPAAVAAAKPLDDGQIFDVAGGITVVATGGPTAGHCAFHLPGRDVLLAGDTVWNVLRFGRLARWMAEDPSVWEATRERLVACSPSIIGAGHGPPVTDDATAKLARLR